MPKITFIELEAQAEHVLDAEVGMSLMEVARNGGIAGIPGDCGGACICGTCHVHIAQAWRERIGPATDIEVATMEFSEDVRPESRLGCQIRITEDLDGLVVTVPSS